MAVTELSQEEWRRRFRMLGRLGKQGMKETNEEIIKIMVGE